MNDTNATTYQQIIFENAGVEKLEMADSHTTRSHQGAWNFEYLKILLTFFFLNIIIYDKYILHFEIPLCFTRVEVAEGEGCIVTALSLVSIICLKICLIIGSKIFALLNLSALSILLN